MEDNCGKLSKFESELKSFDIAKNASTECPICLESFHMKDDSDSGSLGCGHKVHWKCWKEQSDFVLKNMFDGAWIENNPATRCPICRIYHGTQDELAWYEYSAEIVLDMALGHIYQSHSEGDATVMREQNFIQMCKQKVDPEQHVWSLSRLDEFLEVMRKVIHRGDSLSTKQIDDLKKILVGILVVHLIPDENGELHMWKPFMQRWLATIFQ